MIPGARPRAAAAASASSRPLRSDASIAARARASPASSASCLASMSVTGMPPVARLIAMPEPIVPAPSTAALADGARELRIGRRGRAPRRKDAEARATPSTPGIPGRARAPARARPRPAASPPRRALRRCAAAPEGAARPAAGMRRYSSNCAGREGGTGSSETRRSGARAAASSRAQAIAPARRSPSMRRSTMPSSIAGSMPIGLPEAMSSKAACQPASRGNRTVPPAPGSSPRDTSGKPSCRSPAAQR